MDGQIRWKASEGNIILEHYITLYAYLYTFSMTINTTTETQEEINS